MAYTAFKTVLTNVQKDSNSKNLFTAECMSEGVIVGSEAYTGMHVLYMPAGGAVSRWFGDAFGLFRKNTDGTSQGGYLEDTGHIKTIKLRGLRSEGISIPWAKVVATFPEFADADMGALPNLVNGDKIPFVSKYIPKSSYVPASTSKSGKGKARRASYPDFEEHIDTKQLMYNKDAFKEGDTVSISLKMHGTSQRSALTDREEPRGFFRRLFKMPAKRVADNVCGTRRTVLTVNRKTGYHGSDDFRFVHHNKLLLSSIFKYNMAIYYEVVGFANGKPIMTTVPNKKINDPEFIDKYGSHTVYSYGCGVDESAMYVYRINDGGKEYTPEEIEAWCRLSGVKNVPYFETFTYTTWEDLLERVNKYIDGTDPIGETHIREGVVVRILNRPRFTAFKAKNVPFKILEGIYREEAAEPDMEEAQEAAND